MSNDILTTLVHVRVWNKETTLPDVYDKLCNMEQELRGNTLIHAPFLLSISSERVETVLRHHPNGNCRQSVTIQTSRMPPWDMPVQTDLSTLAGLLHRPAFLTCLLGRATSSACKTKMNRNMPGLHHLAASKNQVKILMSPLQLGLDPHMQNV